MIKLFISDAYDLKEIGAKFNKSNIYLGFIRTKGYVLINETNSDAFINFIDGFTEPDLLNINWQEDTKEITEIYSILDNILTEFYPDDMQKLHDVKINITDYLLNSLAFKYESNNFAKVGNAPNRTMRELFLNPVETFNNYTKSEILTTEEFKEKQNAVKYELKETLETIISDFNNNKGVYGYTKKGFAQPLVKESDLIKLINETLTDALANPLVNLKYGNGKQKLNIIESIDYLTDEFKIKGVYKNGSESFYYFDENLNYFEPLTEIKLKNLIIKNLGVKLVKSDYNNIYSSLDANDFEYNNILVFRNILYDMDYMEELNFPVCNYNRTDYLAPALIGFENNNNNIELLDFDYDLDFSEIYNANPDPEKMTFTEQTLRQILIPKDEPNNLKMFHDFLQRLGSCILGQNKFKTITLYYGDGNNGKSILKLLFELVFNRGAYSLTPATFTDKFNLKSFTNRKVLLLDEIMKNSFTNLIDDLKRISSPLARTEQRGMYTDENIIINFYPNLFIFSNVLITIPLTEIALFDRLDFLKLPNSFVTERELNKTPNSYLKDRNTETKLKRDVKGLSWLITASINAFVEMQNSNTEYILKQTAMQTMDILAQTDHLTKFISLYTEIDYNLTPTEFITNEEILQQFKQYLELIGATTTETDDTIKRRISTTIKKVYDIQGKIKDSDIYFKQNKQVASYSIKLKSFDDLEQELKQVFIINEDAGANDYEFLTNDSRLVYNKIQQGTNTINKLNKDLPNYDNYKIVRELLNLNLILRTTQTTITENK